MTRYDPQQELRRLKSEGRQVRNSMKSNQGHKKMIPVK